MFTMRIHVIPHFYTKKLGYLYQVIYYLYSIERENLFMYQIMNMLILKNIPRFPMFFCCLHLYKTTNPSFKALSIFFEIFSVLSSSRQHFLSGSILSLRKVEWIYASKIHFLYILTSSKIPMKSRLWKEMRL